MREHDIYTMIADYLRYQYPTVIYRFDLAADLKLTMGQALRKAVRAWAEAIEINDNKVAFNRYSNGFSCMENEGLFSNITFDGRAFDFVDGKLYTIAELCGEKEE